MPDLQWLSGKCLTEIQKIQVQTPAGPQCFFLHQKKKKQQKQHKARKKNLPYAKAKTNKKTPSVWKKQTNQPTNKQTNKQTNKKISKKTRPHLLFFERSVL